MAPGCGIIIDVAGNNTPGCHIEYAAVAHLVERHLAKVEVASSSLVGRSNMKPSLMQKCKDDGFFAYLFLHRTAKNTLLQADGTVRLQKLCISSCQTARNEVFYSHSLTL